MKTLGLYLHVPFCKSKCRYCDFCSFPHPDPQTIDLYVNALCREIRERGDRLRTETGHTLIADTVYFGGGTPTLLSISQWERMMNALSRSFSIAANAEITTECNPATADRDTFRALRALGINRLSIGTQSINENELKRLGRLHNAADVLRTVSDARDTGWDNISMDIMFGIPEETRESFMHTLRTVSALSPEHLSVYGLQIEDGTPFARHRDTLPLPDEETERSMYMDAVAFLAKQGFSRYEISNFSRPGFSSRHNLKYWHREDYLGLGISAHSCLGNRRFANTSRLSTYLSGNRIDTDQTISLHDMLCESVMLGMRLDEGVDFSELAKQYGAAALSYQKALESYVQGGFVLRRGPRLAFTDDGMYVSNAILCRVLDFDE